MRRGRRSRAPPAATSERLTSGIPRLAPFAATIRSHASAKRSTAAIRGLRAERWAMPAKPRSSNQGASPLTNAPRSMPAQKKPPAPVSTPTDISSSPSSSSRAPAMPAATAALTAFRTSGRLIVISSTLPRRSLSTAASSSMGGTMAQTASARHVVGGRRLDRIVMLVRAGSLAERLTELADPLTEGTGQLRQALGAQHDERDRGDEQQMHRVLDAHETSG